MAQVWRNSAGRLLALYVVLGVIAIAVVAVTHPAPLKAQPLWLPVEVFLAWRVSLGGRVSRVLLILLSACSFAGAVFIGMDPWSPGLLALLAIYAAQVALLVSPAVYHHTRRNASSDLAPPMPARWTPPLWLPLCALLAGLVVTLLYLASMGWAAIPGCGPAGTTIAQLPSRCIGLAEGYPVHFLTAYQGTPLIDKAGLAADWGQWSLVSFAVLYIWLLIRRRSGPAAPGRTLID